VPVRVSRKWYWTAGGVGALLVVVGLVLPIVRADDDDLTIYASLPLQGPQRQRSFDMDAGMRLALKQAGGRVGSHQIRYRLLDDSDPDERGWTQKAVAENANRAADDKSTAVYLGEFNSGATAVSILTLSGKHVPQISAGSTAVGLTSDGPGAGQGEPENHYQDDFRNFVRVVPKDDIQGDALTAIMLADGCTRVGMINDGGGYGAGLARNVKSSAKSRDLRIVFDETIDLTTPDYTARARRAARRGVDCFLFTGDTKSDAPKIYRAMAVALPPSARFYGGDGVADASFTDPRLGGVPDEIAARVQLTIPTLGPRGFGAAGRKFFADFANEYPGNRNPDPYAIYAYESMKLALDAIARAASSDRDEIVKALFATRNRHSVLGTYSIDRNGDTSLTDYGRFAIRDGKPRFAGRIETQV
jgi:branched-chain amino acid transport system substrate-binding protein